MTVERSQVEEALEAAGLDADALQENYSGRGMGGRECIAIVGDLRDFARFVIAFGSENYDWIPDVRVDNLGLAQVFYWPGVTIKEDE